MVIYYVSTPNPHILRKYATFRLQNLTSFGNMPRFYFYTSYLTTQMPYFDLFRHILLLISYVLELFVESFSASHIVSYTSHRAHGYANMLEADSGACFIFILIKAVLVACKRFFRICYTYNIIPHQSTLKKTVNYTINI